MLVTTLGGRAAEELVFDTVTTGAANDIEKATELARNMITRFGMSEKFGLMGLAKVQDMYLSGRASLECGDETATEIDREVMKMLAAAYEEAKHILSENMDILHKIAAYLIEKETITGKEFMHILHEVRGDESSDETAASKDAEVSEKNDGTAESDKNEPRETKDVSEDITKEYERALSESGVRIEVKKPEETQPDNNINNNSEADSADKPESEETNTNDTEDNINA